MAFPSEGSKPNPTKFSFLNIAPLIAVSTVVSIGLCENLMTVFYKISFPRTFHFKPVIPNFLPSCKVSEKILYI